MAQVATATNVTHELRLAMTYEEFLASDFSESHAEWVDGEVTVFMPPNERHQNLVGFMYILLSSFARRLGLGTVFVAPFEMRLRSGQSSREPDLLFIARNHDDRLDGQRVIGPADLVVEIISDSSVGRDRAEKFREYQEAGIPEYLVIDPREGKERIDFYRLGADGKYQPVLPDADGRFHVVSMPGFWFDSAWLWQDPLPDPLDQLATIAPERFGGLARPAAAGSGT